MPTSSATQHPGSGSAAVLSDDDIRTIVEFAGLAPSVHNTQPWHFVARDSTIEVHADDSRRLHYLDPDGRQQVVSCGAAVEYARLAARGLGRSCVVRLLPGGGTAGGPLATLTVGRPQPVTPDEQRLIDAVPRRHTDRGPYDDRPVADRLLRRVRDLVNARGCWLRVLDRPGDRAIAAELLQRAEAMEVEDPEYAEELATWRRDHASDGIPSAAIPDWDTTRSVTDMPLRDFEGHAEHPRPGGQEPPPRVEHDTVILIGSDDDSTLDWLRTGCAVGLAWLAFADDDIAMQPLGPVTDVATTRSWLRRELGLLGQPQMMFRIGHGIGGLATGRRPVTDTLDIAEKA